MARVNLTPAQISAGLGNGDFRLGQEQFTFSIPGASSIWPTYPADGEQTKSYSVLSTAQAAAFRAAIAVWDDLILPHFGENADNATARGEIRIAFTSMEANTAAYAYSSVPQAPGGKAGDIWFNADDKGDSFDTGSFNFEVLIHEIGHALGLKHSFEGTPIPAPYENTRYTVMSYTEALNGDVVSFRGSGGGYEILRTSVTAITPMVLDVAAIQAIYGADPTTRTGADTYRFDQDAKTLQTIYDAGGNDTIDLSNFTRPSTVDLMPGSYSSIGIFSLDAQVTYWSSRVSIPVDQLRSILSRSDLFTHTDNLGIAFSTTIENATGGSAADTISGNAVANVLRGMAGDDTLLGLDGDDRLEGGAGDDTLTGGAGADVFAFTGTGLGVDRIVDFAVGEDRFDLGGGAFTSLTAVSDGTVLRFAGGSVKLDGIQGLTLAAANARVVGAPAAPAGLVAVLPSGDSPVAVGSDLRMVFAGAVTRGSGTITLAKADGTVVESFAADSARLTLAGNVLTIDPTRALDAGTGYTLTMTAGAVRVGGVAFAGLSGAGFSTRAESAIAPAGQFFLALADNGLATAQGTGTVFGTAAAQGVRIADLPGTITLDASFNAGGDTLMLAGAASGWSVHRSGSSAVFGDGDTRVVVPIGPGGIDVQFADRIATLKLNAAGTGAVLGDQALTTTALPVTAANGAATATATLDAGAQATLILMPGGSATSTGNALVYGTSGYETVRAGTTSVLDASFNAGGDVIVLAGRAGDYTVVRSGSTAIFTGAGQTVSVPIGPGRMSDPYAGASVGTSVLQGGIIRFADGDRMLLGTSGGVTLGAQAVTTAATAVTPVQQAAGVLDRDDDANVATPFTFSARDIDIRLADSASIAHNVRVTDFGRGDSLALGGGADGFIFSSSGSDLTIQRVDAAGVLSTTVLVGVADAAIPVTSYASAVAAVGFDFATFTL